MNDWYLDPPDYPEEPECPDCDGESGWDNNQWGDLVCKDCGYVLKNEYPDPDEPGNLFENDYLAFSYDMPDVPCPHGSTAGCQACDIASDLAYDAARERRMFR